MTHIELYPHEVWDKLTMKFMQIFSHFHLRMLKDCRFSDGLKWSALTLRHVSHFDTYFIISLFILVLQKLFFNYWYILLVSGCIECLEQLALYMILRWSSKLPQNSIDILSEYCTSLNSNILQRCIILTSVFWAAMTSSLMVGIRVILVKLSCGTIQRRGSSGSQQEGWDWMVRLLHRCLRLKVSVTTFTFTGW
jgi:hypothetical protein